MTTPGAGSDRPHRATRVGSALERRALAAWPRLNGAALRRCRHDPRRIAALFSRRTSLPMESIMRLLTMPQVTADEGATWFG